MRFRNYLLNLVAGIVPLSGILLHLAADAFAAHLGDVRSVRGQSQDSPVLARDDPYRNSTNLTTSVQWDNYSMFLEDQRVFLHSGEFHTFRLPVPDLWLDIFQKFAAAGLNGASIYIHWGVTNPAPGHLDFNDWRALQPMFDAAKQAGVFIVLRPGPYINAETTAGGLAAWTTSLIATELRTNSSDWEAAWHPYLGAIAKLTAPNQISHGGPVIAIQIENEFGDSPEHGEYWQEMEDYYRANGIVVPFTYNDPGELMGFINGTGSVDLYGVDAYPQRYDCAHPDIWHPVATNYWQYHEVVNRWEPFFMPEFQGGSLDGWGGAGYDGCEALTGAAFEDVFYKNNWAANAKLVSYYMTFGGTNWGGLAFPGVYTSYDYGGAIRESRLLTPKYDELKRQGMFLRSARDFRKTDWIGNSSIGIPGASISNPDVFVVLLQNPDNGAGFFIARQNDSTSTANVSFTLNVTTSKGPLAIPQKLSDGIALNGHQSKVIVTDFNFGKGGKLLYSTANIFFAGIIGARDVILLYGDSDQGTEFQIGSTITAFPPGSVTPGLHVVGNTRSSTDPLVLYADTATASTFWNPVVPGSGPLAHYWQFGSNTSILVGGPYLVRNVTLTGGHLALRGDLNTSTPLTLVVPPEVTAISWNGARVSTKAIPGAPDVLQGQLDMSGSLNRVTVPALKNWKFKDSLPEVQAGFDDSNWIVANHTTTNLTPGPLYGDGRVLFGCDYGFCENTVVWRGHFTGTGSETSVNLTINGGTAFAASVWVNDQFINSTSSTTSEQTNATYIFPHGAVKKGKDNVITVVHDNMGLDENPNERSPRGIPGFLLNNGKFSTWKVQGKLGGYINYPDKVRGLLNEGGLFGERQGWHLPGFDTSSWEHRDLSQGIPGGPGIGFFVTTFDLDIPRDVDAMMSFVFDHADQPYRALLFVNGWQFGKRVANIGPQFRFPVPQGILDYNGKNTVAVALWALGNERITPQLDLVVDNVFEGGVGSITTNNPRWSSRAHILN